MVRPDLIFSYWIYLWYILYLFKIIKYNPKLAIILGIIENLIVLILMYIYNTKKIFVILFTIMFIILKLIPLYTISRSKIIFKYDSLNILILFIIYLIWVSMNNLTIRDAFNNTKNLILYNKNTTPGMIFLHYIYLKMFL
jgi:hypothetical protein